MQWRNNNEHKKNDQCSHISSYFVIDFDPDFYVPAKYVHVKETGSLLHSFMYSDPIPFLSSIFAQILYIYSITLYVDSINLTLPPVPSKSGSISTIYV